MDKAQLDQPWRSPLLPVALAVTAGIVIDRVIFVPFFVSWIMFLGCLAGWAVATWRSRTTLALACLWGGLFVLAGAYHNWYRHPPANNIARFAKATPQFISLRGVLLGQALAHKQTVKDPLRSNPKPDTSQADVQVSAIQQGNHWAAFSGRVRLMVLKPVAESNNSLPFDVLGSFKAGDEIEVVGNLIELPEPENPGEFDRANYFRDQQIQALLVVRHGSGTIVSLSQGSDWLPVRLLGLVRGWGDHVVETCPPFAWRDLVNETAGDASSPKRLRLAKALLLGEQEELDTEQWDRFQRTGVVHVLAVSGQHLMVLAGFLAVMFRFGQVPRSWTALIIPLLLFCYSLLTGWRPPAQRSFFVVAAFYGCYWFRRVESPINSYALAWLLVCLWNPTAIFNAGCQLSFLAVAVLLWGTRDAALKSILPWGTPLFGRALDDPLERLLERQRPGWQRMVRVGCRRVMLLFRVNAMVWLAMIPLVAAHFHLVCPAGLVIGVPVLLLSSLALLTGFAMFVFFPIAEPVGILFAWITDYCLLACDELTQLAERVPGAFFYVPDIPDWWLWTFYLVLLAGFVLPSCRRHWGWVTVILLCWCCVGLGLSFARPQVSLLRCTFLSVGHGSCLVIETPDGRVLLYDAGAIAGPEITSRKIAPFLWSRGYHRIDEIILSHADLDHFNGLNSLLKRFAVGQITATPTFDKRKIAGVELTLDAIKEAGISYRLVKAGDSLTLDEVRIQVLHPPANGPEGIENVRSLVLLVNYQGKALLLTGDLEKNGLEMLLSNPPVAVDVLQAPHHGSETANTPLLASWARPKVVVSSQEWPRLSQNQENPYQKLGAKYLTTAEEGAVTFQVSASGIVVETFKTKQRWVIR